MTAYSILDLAPILRGGDAGQALRHSLDLARHAEQWGYTRYWVAEHHNMPGVASAATSVVIGHIAAGTRRIRVGSGGIMLPNHAPLVIAEQFGTLAALFPGRIDLGLGRAPGTDMETARALRRDLNSNAMEFPRDVAELQGYLDDPGPEQRVRAIPGQGSKVPLWLLGSSLFSARLAAQMGLPFAFASHFAPESLEEALHVYRSHFQPSAQLQQPYAAAGISVFAADSDEEGAYLATSMQQQFMNLRRGRPGPLPPPVENMDELWSPMEAHGVRQAMKYAMIGSRETVMEGLRAFRDHTNVDELIITGGIFDHDKRLRSFDIAAQLCRDL
ncbi:MAG: LLM class flavin-dependent oxidoreductase [Alcanivorax sp.]|uniref:Luciferase-like monooxygenase n=1 Tax=Alloalcanivorax marinus TaxID=1177169 RepID=A0A9Q3YND1_9GAMM|nr:LLM class flavin-dependent oxidoreductase [Alloalcanivorax marinus]MBM7333445.1 LLM class flavin-dependent oxidoreductase [Alloalcanivorax marinus]MCC4308581.1 LLM class flavin-dependent oxidoreductase [Alloalcanivorax marinus]MCU5787628.1 flavin dependent oxidoreductase [Alloalcanivorax marinus]